MSLNERSKQTTGLNTGVTKPASHPFSVQAVNPASGKGAETSLEGAAQALRRVAGMEASRSGIIESTNIDPLSKSSNDDDGWVNVRPKQRATPSSMLSSAMGMTKGVAQMAYGTTAGDQVSTKAGEDAVHSTQ